MNFKHLSLGALFLLIGVALISPMDDFLVLIPLSIYLESPEIIPLVTFVGAILIGMGIFLVGKTTLVHMGVLGKAIAHHPVVIVGSIFVISGLAFWWLM